MYINLNTTITNIESGYIARLYCNTFLGEMMALPNVVTLFWDCSGGV